MPDRGMAIDSSTVGITILIAFEVPNMYSGLLPSLMTIATFAGSDHAEHSARWIRRGELQATAMSLALAGGGALLTRSVLPLLAAGAMCAYLVWQYEKALKSAAADGPGLDISAGAR